MSSVELRPRASPCADRSGHGCSPGDAERPGHVSPAVTPGVPSLCARRGAAIARSRVDRPKLGPFVHNAEVHMMHSLAAAVLVGALVAGPVRAADLRANMQEATSSGPG